MTTERPNRPRDVNQHAKYMVDLATMDADERAALQKRLAKKKKKPVKRQTPGKRGSAKPV